MVVFVAEQQSKVDYHMVFRIMLGESLAYHRQWKRNKKEHREKEDLKTGEELLSGMKKEDKFCPVLSLVVYYGKEIYDGATCLHEMLDWKEGTGGLKKYITNHHISLEMSLICGISFDFIRKFLKLSKIVYNDNEIKMSMTKERIEHFAMTLIMRFLFFWPDCTI